jgi:cytochrome oxidase Cu insertion factor (SCO1/SenC/PrrC family)
VRRLRLLYAVSALVAVAAVLAMLALVAGPRPGTLLVLASASMPERLQAAGVDVHGASGWIHLGGGVAVDVPASPATVKLTQSSLAPGTYDRLRLGEVELPVRIAVVSGVVEPVLVAVLDGRPLPGGVYAGNDNVNLGMAELAGQKTAMPDFDLVDQGGRPFTKASIAGHDTVIAAFHTSCRETCPIYTGLFLQLRKQLPESVLLVEVTTDPATDTPAVLRAYADSVGARWTLATGGANSLKAFWAPFGVELSSGDTHVSTLALVDSHGYIQLVYRGVPDVGGSLPPQLDRQLSGAGHQELAAGGEGWGAAQVADALRTIDGLRQNGGGGGDRAPDFTLSRLDGTRASMSDFAGRPVVINFWATNCPPCRRELPLLAATARDHPEATFLLIDVRDDPAAGRRLLASLGVSADALEDEDGSVSVAYGVVSLPTTVFVRPDGVIEGRWVGATDAAVLDSHLAVLARR